MYYTAGNRTRFSQKYIKNLGKKQIEVTFYGSFLDLVCEMKIIHLNFTEKFKFSRNYTEKSEINLFLFKNTSATFNSYRLCEFPSSGLVNIR